VWDSALAFEQLRAGHGVRSQRAAVRWLRDAGIIPERLEKERLCDELGRVPNMLVLDWALGKARRERRVVLFFQLAVLPGGRHCLHANDERDRHFWVRLPGPPTGASLERALKRIQAHAGRLIAVFPHGELVAFWRDLESSDGFTFIPQVFRPVLRPRPPAEAGHGRARGAASPHLKRLEAESIHIIREAFAEAERPAMLYSIGKDSSVMLHLARKAFYPSVPPFPLLHVDTRWKFQEMYLYRDKVARESGMELLVYTNPEAVERDINPFDHGSVMHTDITKTAALRKALDLYKFDVVFGGARRDEEKSRAKERVFSLRTRNHRWDPKTQRPELWRLFNTKKKAGDSFRVFPLSNWTELDVWEYIYQEDIEVVPLYFARPRPVLVRPELIMAVDDDRCRLLDGEEIQIRKVRFRTLGCYPLSGAVESDAETLEDVILELVGARSSERQGRRIDADSANAMEMKKQEGYF
jgi:sulfate adenylyltransferase subunit 2